MTEPDFTPRYRIRLKRRSGAVRASRVEFALGWLHADVIRTRLVEVDERTATLVPDSVQRLSWPDRDIAVVEELASE